MSRILVIRCLSVVALSLVVGIESGRADTWMPPRPRDHLSADGRYVAHVIPKGKSWKIENLRPADVESKTCHLSVFRVNGEVRELLWECDLTNSTAPLDVRLSDDGGVAVTLDNHGAVGYGDDVVAIYGRKGLLKRYSLEAVLGRPERERMRSFSHSTSSRWWREASFDFFDMAGDLKLYCLWVHHHDEWLCWNLATGEPHKPTREQTGAWDARIRKIALKQIAERDTEHGFRNLALLARLKIPEDRKLVEQWLEADVFQVATSFSGRKVGLGILSRERAQAESLLRIWDGQVNNDTFVRTVNRYLGSVQGEVGLPEEPQQAGGQLYFYLIPASMKPEEVAKRRDLQVARYSIRNSQTESRPEWGIRKQFELEWREATPGEYRLRVVWDRPPLHIDERAVISPGPEDATNGDGAAVTVRKGETADAGTITLTVKPQ